MGNSAIVIYNDNTVYYRDIDSNDYSYNDSGTYAMVKIIVLFAIGNLNKH